MSASVLSLSTICWSWPPSCPCWPTGYTQTGGDIPSDLYEAGGTALFLFLLLGACGYCPLRCINFPFRVKPHNVVYQYVLALRLVRVTNIIFCLQFLFVTLSLYHPRATIGCALCIGLFILAFIGYMVLAWRHK